jgi:hypothetical protein
LFLILAMSNICPGTFHKYISLENIQPLSGSSKSGVCRCWLTKNTSVNSPTYLS